MKHAVYSGTRNLYGDMETAAKSLVANSDVDKVHFLIEDAEFPRPLPDMVECHDVSGQTWFPPDGPNAKSSYTYMCLMRTALALMPEFDGLDEVLYLDCDTLCVADASGLWDIDTDECYFAASPENWAKSRPGLNYCNVGVSLHNLAMLRDGKAAEIVDCINRQYLRWPDQDAMNYLCQGRIARMPPEYNWCPWVVGQKECEPRIIHHAADKDWCPDWHDEPRTVKYRDMTWDEAIELHGYAGKGTVLFASNHSLERDESIRAVWEAYRGPKELIRPVEAIASVSGYPVVVTDTLTPYVPSKDFTLVNIGHGITGDKKYALDEKRVGIDPRAVAQTDYHVCASTKTVGIVARQFGIPEDRVPALGFPRSDMLVGKGKGDGGTFLADYGRAFLYAPTFRGPNDGDRLPGIDWEKLGSLLEDDEVFVVKRHYFQRKPIVGRDIGGIVEISPSEGICPYLIDCDVLVTDYSSTVFDGYVLGKPCVLTVDDMDAYLATRGMYLDYPGQYSSRWLCAEGNEEKLLEMLREAAEHGMTDVERATLDLVADMCDGHASERVCDLVKSLL